MKILLVVPLLLLNSCWLFEKTDFHAALEANAAQRVMFEQHSNAFEKLVLKSDAPNEVKAQIISSIQADRNDFQSFNTSLGMFLTIAGDVDAGEIVDIALQAYRKFKEINDGE